MNRTHSLVDKSFSKALRRHGRHAAHTQICPLFTKVFADERKGLPKKTTLRALRSACNNILGSKHINISPVVGIQRFHIFHTAGRNKFQLLLRTGSSPKPLPIPTASSPACLTHPSLRHVNICSEIKQWLSANSAGVQL